MGWPQKAAIGAFGGLALVLLKLIEVRFLLSEPSSVAVAAAYLTYFAYVVLGVLVAVFFTDDSLELDKRKKNAFITGLLAPSVLLAAISQPHSGGPGTETVTIPKISQAIIGSANAEEPKTRLAEPSGWQSVVITVKKSDLEYGFLDGVSWALGRSTPATPSLYVLGQADSEKKAADFANRVNVVLRAGGAPAMATANVIYPVDQQTWFVSVGQPGRFEELVYLRKAVNSVAINMLSSANTGTEKQIASQLLEGQIIKGEVIFGNVPSSKDPRSPAKNKGG
jgi:hypothetical protein